jgi:hypothetical protein
MDLTSSMVVKQVLELKLMGQLVRLWSKQELVKQLEPK